MYGRRNEILDNESIHETVLDIIKNHVSTLVFKHLQVEAKLTNDDIDEIVETVNENLLKKDINPKFLYNKTEDEVISRRI